EVRDADDVDLPEHLLDAGPLVVELQLLLRRLERKAGQWQLVGRGADADSNGIGASAAADEVADEHRDEVRRHLRRTREDERVLARLGPWLVRQLRAVRDRGVAAVDQQRDVERRLEGGLIPARERAAPSGRLDLR